ncbi:hypothetical protein ACQ4PT_009267 [Festuca glaucescens]
MVPLPGSPDVPCFPQCVEWIPQNQHDNGSWGINEFDSSANKGILSSTLACVIALKKWNVGLEHLTRGLDFIGRNFYIVMDEQFTAPIGFHITFPGMLSLAIGMGLEFPTSQSHVDEILHLREMELKRHAWKESHGEQAYMAYVPEGLGNILDWNKVMKFQRSNGSLFNSPSATTATLIYNYDDKALRYLISLVTEFGSADELSHISEASTFHNSLQGYLNETKPILELYKASNLGNKLLVLFPKEIHTSFKVDPVLGSLQGRTDTEELSSAAGHVPSKAVSALQTAAGVSHSIAQFPGSYITDEHAAAAMASHSTECNPGAGTPVGVSATAADSQSQVRVAFEAAAAHTHTQASLADCLESEVEYALKFPFYATLDRLDHRRNIEYFDAGGSQMLKAEYLPCHVNQDILALAVEDFKFSQSMYQNELQHLDSWLKENRLDQLQFARQRLSYCYLSAASTIFTSELSNARISWSKSAMLTAVVNDL